MDEKAQKYIDKQIEKRRVLYQERKIAILKKLDLGVYEARPKGANKNDYPDRRIVDGKERWCRFIPIQMTDEEFEELKKYIPEERQEHQNQYPMSGWYGFAIAITVISAFVMVAGSGAAAIIGGCVFGYMLFFMLPIICLLAKIERNQHLK